MGKASSSKKVARAARAGGRASGSRQRNLLFPGVIGLVVVLGIGLIAVAASDHKSEANVAPVVNEDHWHAAFGVYICDTFRPAVPTFESPVGIHTHDDDVIHIHPYSSGGSGENATLGVYLEGAGIELSDDELKIGDETWTEGDDTCGDDDAELIVAQWKDVQSTDQQPALIRRDFNDIRFREDGEGYTVAFVPEGTTEIEKPASAAQLAELGAADSATATSLPEGEESPADASETTLPGDASDTTVADEPTDTTLPEG